MAVNVVTEFGANTKKFDAAVEKSSKKAKENLENIGKGARVAGGRIGEMAEKFNNLSSGGLLGTLTAGIGVLLLGLMKAKQLADDMFRHAVEDAKSMHEDLKETNRINSQFTKNTEAALATLRSAAGKERLSNAEMQAVQEALALLQQQGVMSGARIENRQLKGFGADQDVAVANAVNQRRREDIDREMKSIRQIIDMNNELYKRLTGSVWSLWGWAPGASAEANNAAKENTRLMRQLQELEMQRRQLAKEQGNLRGRAEARFKDIEEAAAEKAKKDIEANAQKERAKQIKELNEARAGIKFSGAGQSQVFTNSLTSRGGWAGGARLSSTERFRQQILAYNTQQQAKLTSIEQRIEQLQRI